MSESRGEAARLRVLITNSTLRDRAGSELYVRDLAAALLDRGHTPIAYSTLHGEVAQELRADVPVLDDLDAAGTPPDLIHGHHHLETMTALLRFPSAPAVYVYHGWRPWEEVPPRFPRILRYIAVSRLGRDRLVFEYGIPEDRVRTVLNFVDLARFGPRRHPLPPRPRRALLFANYGDAHTLAIVRQACDGAGMSLDAVGRDYGNICARPETILGQYDLVFAMGRSALEALAVGAAVVLCDARSLGPMVTSDELDGLRSLNFAGRAVRESLTAEALEREIARYDAVDAGEVSRRVRAAAGRTAAVDELVAVYREVIAEWRAAGDALRRDEGRAAAAYLRTLTPRLKDCESIHAAHDGADADRDRLRAEHESLRVEHARLLSETAELSADRQRLQAELDALQRTATLRLRNQCLRIPVVRGVAHALVRLMARPLGRDSRRRT